jgi:hypothetical protein
MNKEIKLEIVDNGYIVTNVGVITNDQIYVFNNIDDALDKIKECAKSWDNFIKRTKGIE